MRYHPAVVAQQAATPQILADGRFLLGWGTGENLNEHVQQIPCGPDIDAVVEAVSA